MKLANPSLPEDTASAPQRGLAVAASVGLNPWIPGIAFSLGVATIPLGFWSGVALMTVSVIWFFWLFHRGSGLPGHGQRKFAAAASILIYLAILYTIWVPASIYPFIDRDVGNYEVGRDIYGLKWQDNFSELSIVIPKNRLNDFTNLNMLVRTDKMIAGIGMHAGASSCGYDQWFPVTVSPMYFNLFGLERPVAKPSLKPGKSQPNPVYYIHCERLSAMSDLDIRLAIVDGPLSKEKVLPEWAKLWISVGAGYREVLWSIEKCFVDRCRGIPSGPAGNLESSNDLAWSVDGSPPGANKERGETGNLLLATALSGTSSGAASRRNSW